MSQNYLIPEYLLNYVRQFAFEIPFYHRQKYNDNFPPEGDEWLKQTGYDRKVSVPAEMRIRSSIDTRSCTSIHTVLPVANHSYRSC